MYIKCWGSRGSIPVSGKEYIQYGGDTTCLEIRTKSDDIIIVDSGTGIRRLGNKLVDEGRSKFNFIFTHAHWDHLMGFPFFKPIFSENAEFLMHKCPFPHRYVENMLAKVMAPPNFPVKYSDLKAKITYMDGCATQFEIGSVKVVPIPISHPNRGNGYKFIEDGKTFVFLTDNELGFIHPGGLTRKDYLEFSKDADLLFHDGEFTPKEYKTLIEWGHSTYTDVVDMACEAGVKKLGLFHLNQERTDKEMNQIVARSKKRISKNGGTVECFGVACGMSFDL